MFTRGLQDFIAPAVELLMAHFTASAETGAQHPFAATEAAAPDVTDDATPAVTAADTTTLASSERDARKYKLLVYLRCCLRGQHFPPGAGPLPSPHAGITKAAMLGEVSIRGDQWIDVALAAVDVVDGQTCRLRDILAAVRRLHAVRGQRDGVPVMESVWWR